MSSCRPPVHGAQRELWPALWSLSFLFHVACEFGNLNFLTEPSQRLRQLAVAGSEKDLVLMVACVHHPRRGPGPGLAGSSPSHSKEYSEVSQDRALRGTVHPPCW